MRFGYFGFFCKIYFLNRVLFCDGGCLEKRGVICVGYGVWGAQVPSEPFGGVGGGGVSPQYLTYPVI